MSLDVSLYYENDGHQITVYDGNITHNLGAMARAAGIYEAMWRPEEKGWTTAKDITPVLEEGLRKLRGDRSTYEKFNAPNGWGLYEHFVPSSDRKNPYMEMIRSLLIKLGIICPKCGEKYWTFTYGKPPQCGY